MGFVATVVVDVCRQRVCGITIEHRPKRDWFGAFGDLKGELETKYGAPNPGNTPVVTVDCRTDEAVVRCIADEIVDLRYTWTWTTGERLNLFLGKGDSADGAPAIRLQYLRPPKRIKPKAANL